MNTLRIFMLLTNWDLLQYYSRKRRQIKKKKEKKIKKKKIKKKKERFLLHRNKYIHVLLHRNKKFLELM